ncbi:MAG: hypothetical protein Q4G68_10280 [Planctomycetia bacterium]|nr:hypothetical protein [Planctomycetia bacterium]
MATERKLLEKITCPHCWEQFSPKELLFISSSPELLGDFRLGDTEQQRFLPSRFDVQGNAIDAKGYACQRLACPHCHLPCPQSHMEMRPFFISIAGAPASGKSYFLASMTWRLRKTLPKYFFTSFQDSDPQMNARLHEYESMQFLNDDDSAVVSIEKTQEQGDLYNTVLQDDQAITYPQPFLFSVTPTAGHVNESRPREVSVSLALYDNAGESYLPVRDSDRTTLPVTRHLGKSHCIFFLFDPTQDNRFRLLCREGSADLQFKDGYSQRFRRSPLRQEMVLAEVVKRARTYGFLTSSEKYRGPLVIVVTKLDAWRHLLPNFDFRSPWARTEPGGMSVFLRDQVLTVSKAVRELLMLETPEIVSAAEQFASNVVYIPVSATGRSPSIDPRTKDIGFASKDIHPLWVETPLLYSLTWATRGIIPYR